MKWTDEERAERAETIRLKACEVVVAMHKLIVEYKCGNQPDVAAALIKVRSAIWSQDYHINWWIEQEEHVKTETL